MSTATEPAAPVSKAAFWTGWVLTILPIAMLTMSGVMKLTNGPGLEEGMTHLGWPMKFAVGLAIIELTCTALYLIPQTAVLGAVLLTGYLGGAIATHVRAGDPFTQYVTIIVLGVVIWLALFLREPRLRKILPLRT